MVVGSGGLLSGAATVRELSLRRAEIPRLGRLAGRNGVLIGMELLTCAIDVFHSVETDFSCRWSVHDQIPARMLVNP